MASTLRYALVGFQAHEAMAFKTMVRLLHNSLACIWQYEAAGHAVTWASVLNAAADIWIVTTDVWQQWQFSQSQPDDWSKIVVFGNEPVAAQLLKVSKPITSDGLVKILNLAWEKYQAAPEPETKLTPAVAIQPASSWIDEPVRRFKTVAHFESSTPAHSSGSIEASESQQLPHLQPGSTYQLLRWPQAAHLKTPPQIRMATALTGRALSFDDFLQVSRQDEQTCINFLQEMRALAYLTITSPSTEVSQMQGSKPPSATAPPSPSAKSGLLSMIRRRLGL